MSKYQFDAERAKHEWTDYERRRLDSIQASLGDGNGNINVSGREGWVYIRLHGDSNMLVEARCPTSISLTEDYPVDVERVRTGSQSFYQIIGRSVFVRYDRDPFWSSGISGSVAPHGSQHERRDRGKGGPDPINVYPRMLTPLRARQQETPDMTVYVDSGFYELDGYREWAGGSSPAFTPPSGFGEANRYDLLYLFEDGALHIATGTAASWEDTPTFPAVPLNSVAIAFIFMTNEMTTIQEENILDARVVLTASDKSADPALAIMNLLGWN